MCCNIQYGNNTSTVLQTTTSHFPISFVKTNIRTNRATMAITYDTVCSFILVIPQTMVDKMLVYIKTLPKQANANAVP